MAIRTFVLKSGGCKTRPTKVTAKPGLATGDSPNHPPTGVTQRLFRTHRMISPNVAIQYSSRCASSQANSASCASFEVRR